MSATPIDPPTASPVAPLTDGSAACLDRAVVEAVARASWETRSSHIPDGGLAGWDDLGGAVQDARCHEAAQGLLPLPSDVVDRLLTSDTPDPLVARSVRLSPLPDSLTSRAAAFVSSWRFTAALLVLLALLALVQTLALVLGRRAGLTRPLRKVPIMLPRSHRRSAPSSTRPRSAARTRPPRSSTSCSPTATSPTARGSAATAPPSPPPRSGSPPCTPQEATPPPDAP